MTELKTQNALNTTANELNIERLEDIVKDVRNTRKAVLAIDKTQAENEKKKVEAQTALQKAIDTSDLEGMTKHTGELKRAMMKLAEKPDDKIHAFNDALDRLHLFANDNSEVVGLEAVA